MVELEELEEEEAGLEERVDFGLKAPPDEGLAGGLLELLEGLKAGFAAGFEEEEDFGFEAAGLDFFSLSFDTALRFFLCLSESSPPLSPLLSLATAWLTRTIEENGARSTERRTHLSVV